MDKKQAEYLATQIERIWDDAEMLEGRFSGDVAEIHPAFFKSACNLLHYIALRHHDIRGIQEQLAMHGLSSLGRAEAHVYASMHAVRTQLLQISGGAKEETNKKFITYKQSRHILEEHTKALLGAEPEGRSVRVMVTMGSEFADDYTKVKELLQSGMDSARINCARDDKHIWKSIIDHIRRARIELKKECSIVMDLAGPKIRTGSMEQGARVLKVMPPKNIYGSIVAPVRVSLVSNHAMPPTQTEPCVPVDKKWIESLKVGDVVKLKDSRNKKRIMKIISCDGKIAMAEISKTTWFATGLLLSVWMDKEKTSNNTLIGELPEIERKILLKPGDSLILHADDRPGMEAVYNEDRIVIHAAHISCTLPEVFRYLEPGDPVLFDDGVISGVVSQCNLEEVTIKITGTKSGGSRLGADKGINFPSSDLRMSGLTEKDLKDLPFLVRHADIINLSFVNRKEDVRNLIDELKKHKAENIGIMLKIETNMGFQNLPILLLELMKWHPAGIMIARGDLAVECGWMRLAEVQEEILWLCEAAYIPVVWATQVLETLSKKGHPSRAEITDAAMSQRADCVMLNKGEHILDAIRMLDNILKRMQHHQYKKSSMLRRLNVSDIGGFGTD